MVVSIILVDQLTKVAIQSNFSYGSSLPIVKGFFNLTYVRNTGGAFGLFAGANEYIRMPLFLLLPVLASIWFVGLIWANRNKSLLSGVAYSLILAGAVGNLMDRFFTDMLWIFWISTGKGPISLLLMWQIVLFLLGPFV